MREKSRGKNRRRKDKKINIEKIKERIKIEEVRSYEQKKKS